MRNQGGDAGNQSGKLSIAVEITWDSNGNDKLKDWKEVKIINLVSHIWPGSFLVNFEEFLAQCLSVFIIDFKQVDLIFFSTDISVFFPETIFKVSKPVHALFTMLVKKRFPW